jgi:hypothetical protein
MIEGASRAPSISLSHYLLVDDEIAAVEQLLNSSPALPVAGVEQ